MHKRQETQRATCSTKPVFGLLLVVVLLATAVSVSCRDDDEALALTEFRELRSALADQMRLFLEAGQQGDTAMLQRLGDDSAVAHVLRLAKNAGHYVDSAAWARMENFAFKTEAFQAGMKYSVDTYWFYVFFVRDEDGWRVRAFMGPVDTGEQDPPL